MSLGSLSLAFYPFLLCVHRQYFSQRVKHFQHLGGTNLVGMLVIATVSLPGHLATSSVTLMPSREIKSTPALPKSDVLVQKTVTQRTAHLYAHRTLSSIAI